MRRPVHDWNEPITRKECRKFFVGDSFFREAVQRFRGRSAQPALPVHRKVGAAEVVGAVGAAGTAGAVGAAGAHRRGGRCRLTYTFLTLKPSPTPCSNSGDDSSSLTL